MAAEPAVIAAIRVEVFAAPSKEASVISELGRGAPICVLDNTNYPGVLNHRLGWLAIRLPGGVGYVPIEDVDLKSPAPEVANCSALAAASGALVEAAAAPAQARDVEPPPRRVARMAVIPPLASREAEPAEVPPRSALIAHGFLPPRPARFLLGMGTGLQWLDKASASMNQIDDSGITLNGTVGLVIYDVVMISAMAGVAFPSDHGGFSQEVELENGGGDAHTADSSLTVASYSIAAGLRTPFWALGQVENGWVAGALFAQYGSSGVGGSRSIENCVDCRKDDIELPGGTFWLVGFDLLIPSRKPSTSYGLTLAYQHYVSGAGLSDEVRVGCSFWFQ